MRTTAISELDDLYKVGHETVTCELFEDEEMEIPFAHQLKIHISTL